MGYSQAIMYDLSNLQVSPLYSFAPKDIMNDAISSGYHP